MAGVTDFSNSKETSIIAQIKKRDGRIVNFEQSRTCKAVPNAIYKALVATGKPDYPLAEKLAARVVQRLVAQGEKSGSLSVESVMTCALSAVKVNG